MTRTPESRPDRRFERFVFVAIDSLRRTVGRVFWVERIAFYELGIEEASVRRTAPPFDIDFVVPTPDELHAKFRDPLAEGFRLGPAKIRRRLSRSHVAVLALRGTAPVAMVWLSFTDQEVSEIGRTLVLRPHEVLTYDEFTLPAWRGKGISPALNQFADEYAARRNATRRITWRSVGNAPAIRVAEKLGHKLLTVATTLRIASRWHPFVLGLDSAEPPLEFRRH